jgi:hypothetical protein
VVERRQQDTTASSSVSHPSLTTPAALVPPQLMQANYDTLLGLISQERKIRNALNDKIASLEHTLLETSTSFQIEVDELR